uniref:Uncharacterized protein n=1 Tax=Cacopsylla melanoneura TaxID=428564 RepID=A0A8D9BCU3_9HEMI
MSRSSNLYDAHLMSFPFSFSFIIFGSSFLSLFGRLLYLCAYCVCCVCFYLFEVVLLYCVMVVCDVDVCDVSVLSVYVCGGFDVVECIVCYLFGIYLCMFFSGGH